MSLDLTPHYMKYSEKEILIKILLEIKSLKTEIKITNQHLSGMRADIAVMKVRR